MNDTFKDHSRKDIALGGRAAKVRQTFMRRVQAHFCLRFHMALINGSAYDTREWRDTGAPIPAVTLMSGHGKD